MDSTPHQICEKFLNYIEKEELAPSLVTDDVDFQDAPKHPDQDVRMAWFYLMDKLYQMDKRMEKEPEVCIRVLNMILANPDPISYRTAFKYVLHSEYYEDSEYRELSRKFYDKFCEHFDHKGEDDEFLFLKNRLSSQEEFPRGDDPHPED